MRRIVHPLVRGRGRRPFPDGRPAGLELDAARSFDSGVVLLSYRTGLGSPAGST